MKVLSPRRHGYLDCVIVALFLGAPTLFSFGGLAAKLCYVLSAVHVTMTLLTDFPLGGAKVIPFPTHAGVEVAVSVALLASPWLLGFAAVPAARNFFVAAGALVGLVWLLTDYKAAESVYHRAPFARYAHPGDPYP